MNDRDWLKRRRRGPAGGCARLAAAALALPLGLRLAAGCGPAPTAPSAPTPQAAPPPAEVVLPDALPVAMPAGAPQRCLIGAPGRVQVDGPKAARPGGPVDALLADPQARVRPELQGRTALPLVTLTGTPPAGGAVRVTACDGAEVELSSDRLSPYDAVVLVDDRAGGVDLVDSREPEPLLRGVSWVSRR